MDKAIEKEIIKRRYCANCGNDAETVQVMSDLEYDHYLCKGCGNVWKHPCIPGDVTVLKEFLEEQFEKVSTLIESYREFREKYPNNPSIYVAFDSLTAHHRILCTAIEMLEQSAPFKNVEKSEQSAPFKNVEIRKV